MIAFKLFKINNHIRSNRVSDNDRNLSRRCKITVWQLAMGIYIPLPYCHIDMILENAWFSNFQKDYLGHSLTADLQVVDKWLCLLLWVHYICVVQRETKRESSPPTFRLGFLLVTPLARERRRSFEITYLGVKVHRPLSPPRSILNQVKKPEILTDSGFFFL